MAYRKKNTTRSGGIRHPREQSRVPPVCHIATRGILLPGGRTTCTSPAKRPDVFQSTRHDPDENITSTALTSSGLLADTLSYPLALPSQSLAPSLQDLSIRTVVQMARPALPKYRTVSSSAAAGLPANFGVSSTAKKAPRRPSPRRPPGGRRAEDLEVVARQCPPSHHTRQRVGERCRVCHRGLLPRFLTLRGMRSLASWGDGSAFYALIPAGASA